MFSNIFLLINNKNILLNAFISFFITAIPVLVGGAAQDLLKSHKAKKPRISWLHNFIQDLIVKCNSTDSLLDKVHRYSKLKQFNSFLLYIV